MKIALGTNQGVLVLQSTPVEGASWTLVSHGLVDRRIQALAQAPDGTLYAGSSQGLLGKTQDEGKTWRTFSEGLGYASIHSLSLHPSEPEQLYAGLQPAAICRTSDGGAHWERLSGFNAVPSAGTCASTSRLRRRLPGRAYIRRRSSRCPSSVCAG